MAQIEILATIEKREEYDEREEIEELNLIRKEANKRENSILLGLENEIQNLRSHIEEDDRLIDEKLKEMSQREILDKDLKALQKDVLVKTRKNLDLREKNIWHNLEENLKYLRDHIDKEDRLISEQQNHIKEQQSLIENQCKVIQELVKISKEQQAEMINFSSTRKFRIDTSSI